MSYTPNFTDPRVVARIQDSVTWCNNFLSINNEQWLSTREIQKQFGSQSRPLGKWLRLKLLICVNSYYDPLKAVCKTYKLNSLGYQEVCKAIGFEPKFAVSQKIEQELITGEFAYTTKQNRDFTSAQYIPKERRRSILENYGYRFHYDIEAAAATLLLQRAQQVFDRTHPNSLEACCTCPALNMYIINRSQVRKQIAQECNTSETTVKLVINGILQGGRLSRNSYSRILKDLHWDYDLVLRLQNNQTLTGIRNDIKSLWVILKDEFPVRYQIDKNGLQRKRALSGGDKSGYYRQLEEQVGVVIKRYLKRDKNKHLWIHDGWSCEKIVDDVELIAEVKRQTGFVIKLDRELFDHSDLINNII